MSEPEMSGIRLPHRPPSHIQRFGHWAAAKCCRHHHNNNRQLLTIASWFFTLLPEISHTKTDDGAESFARHDVSANCLRTCLVCPTGSQWFCPGHHCWRDHLLLLTHHPGLPGLPPGTVALPVFLSPQITVSTLSWHDDTIRNRNELKVQGTSVILIFVWGNVTEKSPLWSLHSSYTTNTCGCTYQSVFNSPACKERLTSEDSGWWMTMMSMQRIRRLTDTANNNYVLV